MLQQTVLWIDFPRLDRRLIGQLKRPSQHNRPDQLLDRPALVDEARRQMVEQFRMRRQLADVAEVIDRPHESRSE